MDIMQNPIALPDNLYLESTNRCNLRCRTCVQHRGMPEPSHDISLKEAEQIGAAFPALKRVVLHGIGEPLLNKHLPALVHFFKSKGAYVLFNSNALLLNRRTAEQLLQSGLDELRTSLDAGSASTYARVRDSRKYSRAIRNIETLIQLRNKNGQSTPKVSAWMVATRENIHDLPQLIELASRIGVAEVYLQRLVYPLDGPGCGLATQRQTIVDPPADIQRLIDSSLQLSRRLNVTLNASGLDTPARSLLGAPKSEAPWRHCLRPWEVAYITAGGNVLPCCIAPFSTLDYEALILGNVFAQNFAAIWQGEKFRRFRAAHQSLSPAPCCRGCGVAWSL